jgi:hypothetical protein
MQTIQNHWRKAAFNDYVAQVQGFLTSQFGVVANARGLALVSEYYARGRSPYFCAWALARHDRLGGPS